MDADTGGGLGPLVLEVLSGADDRLLWTLRRPTFRWPLAARRRLTRPGVAAILGHRLQAARAQPARRAVNLLSPRRRGAVGREKVLGRRRRGSRRWDDLRRRGRRSTPRPNAKRGSEAPCRRRSLPVAHPRRWTCGGHRPLRRVAPGHPHLAAQGDNGTPGDSGRGDLVLADVVGEAVGVAVVGRLEFLALRTAVPTPWVVPAAGPPGLSGSGRSGSALAGRLSCRPV